VTDESYRAHGQSFHISIWHVALNGIADEEYVEHVRSCYEEVHRLNLWLIVRDMLMANGSIKRTLL
jgi:hypothetical protein